MRRFVVAVSAICYFLLTTGSARAAEGICQCDDMAQLQQRIDFANIAADAYGDQLKRTPPDKKFTWPGHDAIETAVAQVLDIPTLLVSPFVVNPPSRTDKSFLGCSYQIRDKGATDCMKASLHIHEQVHVQNCHIWETLDEFIQEEINAYKAEREFLIGERDRLLCTCPYYALRFRYQGLTSIQVPNETVTGESGTVTASKPEVDIPLKIQERSVTGQAQTTIKGSYAGTGLGQCQIQNEQPVKLGVTGNFTPKRVLQVDLAARPGDQSRQGQCIVPGRVFPMSGTTKPAKSATFSFNIEKLDTPDRKHMSPGTGIDWNFSAELVVADPWPQTKAKNGRGSTVGEALHEIGMPDCAEAAVH